MSRSVPRILVVDDDPDIRGVIREFLTPDGYEVRLAANGREAFGILGLRAERKDDVVPVIETAMSHRGPVVIDFQVKFDENCYPMVPPGASLDETIDQPNYDDILPGITREKAEVGR